MIKSDEELQLARHSGQVAMAMMAAGRDAIREGVPEYEVALATAEAGARSAAELLADNYDDGWMSPNTHFLQIMASGPNITMAHRRPTLRQITRGDPVFLCFCGMANFHRFKLGFDRTFWLGEIQDPRQAEIYEVAVASQRAALEHVRPGVLAEEVHASVRGGNPNSWIRLPVSMWPRYWVQFSRATSIGGRRPDGPRTWHGVCGRWIS